MKHTLIATLVATFALCAQVSAQTYDKLFDRECDCYIIVIVPHGALNSPVTEYRVQPKLKKFALGFDASVFGALPEGKFAAAHWGFGPTFAARFFEGSQFLFHYDVALGEFSFTERFEHGGGMATYFMLKHGIDLKSIGGGYGIESELASIGKARLLAFGEGMFSRQLGHDDATTSLPFHISLEFGLIVRSDVF